MGNIQNKIQLYFIFGKGKVDEQKWKLITTQPNKKEKQSSKETENMKGKKRIK